MDRRHFVSSIAAGFLAKSVAAQGPPAGRVARIGFLSLNLSRRPGPLNEALMQGLRERAYVEGRNILIEYADALGREDRLPEIAADLARSQVDLILVIGPAPLAAARKATTTIPLVMVASSADPVAEGAAASLARPGGNVTGLTYAEPDRFNKQLEMLKSVGVRTTRVGSSGISTSRSSDGTGKRR
jgi:putative ABC transport system substrate-binding protein